MMKIAEQEAHGSSPSSTAAVPSDHSGGGFCQVP